MKKIIRLSESDLTRIVKRVINEMDDEKSDEVYNMFGHCIGRTEKPCKYTHSDLGYEILDNDFDMDIKLKRIGLKLTKSSEDADGFVEYKIWDIDVYNDMFNQYTKK